MMVGVPVFIFEKPVQPVVCVHCEQDFFTDFSDTRLVQQHPDDFFFWGSLCNTMASSLVSSL